MLTLKSDKLNYGINLPTSIDEITKDILGKITNNIALPKYYAVIALCKKVNLAQFLLATSGNKKANVRVSVVPIIAKIGEEAAKEINAEAGQRAIIAVSDLEMGNHLNINTAINDSNVRNYLDSDEALRRDIFSGNKYKEENVYIVEFKVVAVSTIHGTITHNVNIDDDPFIVKDK